MSVHTKSYSSVGYVYVALAAFLWASSGSASKFLFLRGMTAFQVVQLRITLSSAILLVWLMLRHPRLLKISRQDLLYFFILGAGAMASVQFAYLFAISKIQVAAAILLQYLAPVLLAFYSTLILREPLHRSTIYAILITLAGCYLVVGGYNLQLLSMNRLGIASGLLSAVCFAWYSTQGEYGMHRYNPWTVHVYSLLFATMTWNIFHPPFEALLHAYRPIEWGWILYITIMGTLLPFGLYFQGINLIRSTRACITATLEPIIAGVISWIFLGEILKWPQLLGGIMVIGAIIMLQLTQEQDEKSPDPIRAKQSATPQSK